jgi:hypothetical protein
MSESGPISINGSEFNLSVCTDLESRLVVTLVNTETTQQYSNTFTASFIQNMTRSTGNYKSFAIFCEMLIKCLTSTSSDCLSFDFKLINRKNYLILCYSIKFDKVFYPLPLQITSEIHQQLQSLILKNDDLTLENNQLKTKIECIKNGLLDGSPITHLLVTFY